jgi:hypothetical protein
MESEFAAQLAEVDAEEWSKIGTEMPEYPDATYILQVRSCSLKRAKSEKQTLMIVTSWLIIDGGEYDGLGFTTRNFPFIIPWGTMFTNRLIRGLGFETPSDPSELPGIVDKIHEAAPQVKAVVTGKPNEDFGGRDYTVVIKNLLGAGERVEREETKKPTTASRTVGATEKITVGGTVSFKDNEGEAHEGIVKSIKGKEATIHEGEVGPGNEPWVVAISKLTIVDSEPEASEGEEPEGDDLDALDRKALRRLITEEGLGIQTYASWDEDKIREAIREARPEPEEPEEPEDPEVPEETAEEPEEAEEPEGGGDRLSIDDLIAIGQSHGINITDNDDNDAVVEKLTARTWDKSKLTEDEYDKLNGLGCNFSKPAAAKPKARGSVARKGGTKKSAKKAGKKKKGKR